MISTTYPDWKIDSYNEWMKYIHREAISTRLDILAREAAALINKSKTI